MSCTSFILIRAEIRGLGISLTLKISWPAADVPQISEDVNTSDRQTLNEMLE